MKTPTDPALRTGAQILCEALVRQGVDVIFGIPGGAIMPFYHALPEYADQLHHVLCRHEQGAGHAAEGYARASGRVGVCVATSGPGATNLVTPIADAWMDSSPMVAITGQVSSALLGTDAFQETDIIGITVPITKHSYLVRDARELPRVVAEAFHIASTGRPGPVLIDITKDAQQASVVPDWETTHDLAGYDDHRLREIDSDAVGAAVELLVNAERPLILAGNGVIQSGATAELLALAECTGIPVITTLHGLGAFPQNHPLSLGMPGMHGWVHVNRAIQRCDVLLNIGSRFDDRVTGKASTFAPNASVIHVDVDPSEIGKLVAVEVGIVGDAAAAMRALITELSSRRSELRSCGMTDFQPWLDEVHQLREQFEPRQEYRRRPDTNTLQPHDVCAALNAARHLRGNCRVVTDVGQHQMWTAQLLDWQRPRSHITSGGSGTMGFAVPAALGAAMALPDETIWVVVGDGGFQMTNQEIATMAQEGLTNVKIAIVNNGYLGMVRQWQQLFEGKRYSGTPLTGPDFAKLAEAYGVRGMTVDSVAHVDSAIEDAWNYPGIVVIDFRVEREANVFPIVPQGRSIGEMMTDAHTHAPATDVGPALAGTP
ncbi:MAG: acetolactate synthase, large subunit, biosynthetic type [Gemmatimonadetes bacterium]|nr:acetolactate synthase, large subunit, biosynthetic type [Gemmatimonadota bacterium]